MDKCPYCGAETRPGDNFCLNCGNRLVPTSFSAQPQPEHGEETQVSPEEWNPVQDHTVAATLDSYSTASEPTATAESVVELPTQRSETPLMLDSNSIEHPARLSYAPTMEHSYKSIHSTNSKSPLGEHPTVTFYSPRIS